MDLSILLAAEPDFWGNMLSTAFEVIILPILAWLVSSLVKWIKSKTEDVKEKTKNETLVKYIGLVEELVTNCVLATHQTYVEALKKEGKFDAEAQKTAFNKTYKAVLSLVSEDALDILSEAFGDADAYIRQLIESAVKKTK